MKNFWLVLLSSLVGVILTSSMIYALMDAGIKVGIVKAILIGIFFGSTSAITFFLISSWRKYQRKLLNDSQKTINELREE